MAAGLVLIALMAACAPRVDTRGHVPNPEALATIQAGVQTRADVAELLGSPSVVGTFDDARWYYITRRVESGAFYEEELLEQQIVVIAFDDAGVVSEVASLDPAVAREIDPASAETPTRGRELGFFEQLLGNIGTPAVGTRSGAN